MPCIVFRAIDVLQSDHSQAVTWRCRHFSTSKPPSERRQCCSDGTLFGGAAVDTKNCRPGAVGGRGLSIVNGDFWKTRVNLSTCRGTGLPQKIVENKSIWNGFIIMIKINPSERIFFGGQKWNVFFHRCLPKTSPTSKKPTCDKSARKKTTKNKIVR